MNKDIQEIVDSVIEQSARAEQSVLDEESILRVKHAVFDMVELELAIVERANKDTSATLERRRFPYQAAAAVELLMRKLLEE